MPMEAAVLYLRKIRELRRQTQAELANAVGVHKRTIERLERNEGNVAADSFLNIIAELRASVEHVSYLATEPSASLEEAENLAIAWVDQGRGATDALSHLVAISLPPWGFMPPAVRAYMRTLRESSNYPLETLDRLISLSSSQWLAWEQGQLDDVPTRDLFLVIADMNGSFIHVLQLIETNASVDEAVRLAEGWTRQWTKEQYVPVTDEMDTVLVKHTRRLSREQKQRVLEYVRWIEDEIIELQLNLNEVSRSEQSRAEFALINDLSQQLVKALESSSWIESNRWLWHIGRLLDTRKIRSQWSKEIEAEKVQQALEEVVLDKLNPTDQADNLPKEV